MNKYMKIMDLIKNHHVATFFGKDKQKSLEHMVLFIDAIIFNMVSIFCLIAIINNSSNITEKTLEVGIKHLETRCHGKKPIRQSGGDRLGSATFLGIPEPVYQESNAGNDILFVDFNNGVARPQIGGMYKQDIKLHKFVKTYVKDILQYHNITATSSIKKKIAELIINSIDCLINCIYDGKKKLSYADLKKILKHHHWQKKKK